MKKTSDPVSRPFFLTCRFFGIAGAGLLGLSLAAIWSMRAEAPESTGEQAAQVAAPAAAPHSQARELVWLADPMAGAVRAPPPPAYIVKREKKLRALMLSSPPHYFTMTLGELTKLAKQGDGNAMQQLAEQYLNEADRLRRDPDFPAGADTRELATQYLKDAMMAGRIRNAALLSKQLFDENKLGDAYAWRLLSQRLGDGDNPVWGRDTNQFAGMTDAEKAQASLQADALYDALYKNQVRLAGKSRDASGTH